MDVSVKPPLSVIDPYSERLVAELHRLGVRHLARLAEIEPPSPPMPPAELIAGLALSGDARLQAALILLFLRQPAYSHYLPDAFLKLPQALATEVKLFYQAAVYLQVDLAVKLQAYLPLWLELPDLFSEELDLPTVGSLSSAEALVVLGQRHAQLTGLDCNWAESYRQNIPRFLKHLHNDSHRYRARTTPALSG
jgi:hypothetical protein